MSNLVQLDPGEPEFPPPQSALSYPSGLLAVGGNLRPQTLLNAYRRGIFPWYELGQPILWWSPDPRCVLFPERLHISRSLRKTLRRGRYTVTSDQAFAAVIKHCAGPRPARANNPSPLGTWIVPEMAKAYTRLFELGYAHSVECWMDGQLAGGLYGLAIGRVFCGESMFSHCNNASKIAFAHLVRGLGKAGFTLIDCQVESQHLRSLGAESLDRSAFLAHLQDAQAPTPDWPKTLICTKVETDAEHTDKDTS